MPLPQRALGRWGGEGIMHRRRKQCRGSAAALGELALAHDLEGARRFLRAPAVGRVSGFRGISVDILYPRAYKTFDALLSAQNLDSTQNQFKINISKSTQNQRLLQLTIFDLVRPL